MARTSPSLKFATILCMFLFISAAFAQESGIRRSGKLELFYVDRANSATLNAFLNTGSSRIPLHFKHVPPNLRHGDQVTVEGTFAAADGGMNVTNATSAVSASTGVYGVQTTLVILINFSDNTATPFTTADTNATYFGTGLNTVSGWYQDDSFGQVWLTGTSVGPFTLAAGSSTCDYSTWYNQAIAAAQASGVVTTNYAHHVLVFPQVSACGWAGLSTIGGNPSWSFINGTLNIRIPVHEMGHTFGLYHAHSLGCGLVPLLSDETQCTKYEYGDMMDVMGTSTGQLSAYHKESIGWLNANGLPPITTVSTGGGSFIIGAYEAQDSNVKALKIPRTSSEYFYVEYRTQTGADTNIPAGVLVRLGGTADNSDVLDMTPTSPTTFSNAVLPVGATFTDPLTGITIQTVAQDGTAATIAVNGATSVTPPPSPTPTPSISVLLTTNSTTYTSKGTLLATVKVVSGTGTVGGAAVTLTITRPDNTVVNQSGTTSSNGTVNFSYKFRPKDPKGNYKVQAVATSQGLTATSTSVYLALQ